MKRNSSILVLAFLALVVAALCCPSLTYATLEEDQTPLSQGEIDAAIQEGLVEDESVFAGEPATMANSSYAVRTVAGTDRYITSSNQALSAFTSSEYAIVASGIGYPDSIAAAGLAGALNCPIILTEPSYLRATTKDALVSLGVKHIILLGSEDVASARVESELKALLGAGGTFLRLAGVNRYETQMAIYSYGVEHGLWTGDTAIVTTATDFADALSVSPISFKLKAPVFFCDDTTTLPTAQYKAVMGCGKTRFFVIGSATVTSNQVVDQLSELGTTVRLGGINRWQTSQAINYYAVANLGFSWDGVAMTSGNKPYDALGGGPVQGVQNSLLALCEEGGSQQTVTLPFNAHPSSIVFFGDKAVYTMAFKTKFALALGFDLSDIQGFRVYIDAGHGQNNNNNGAYDPGASAFGYQEATLTRELAQLVANQLKMSYGIDSYVNDDGGWYKLRQAEASNLDCGLFISLHFNASGGTGTEAYIHTYNAASGSSQLRNSCYTNLVNALGLRDRGQFAGAFAVLSGKVPATLLEICFIDNQNDMNTYVSRKANVAAGIARGIATL